MASKAAAKTVSKVAKSAKSVPKAKPAAADSSPKVLAAKENAGFKESTARELVNKFPGKLSLNAANDVQTHIFSALKTSLAKSGRVAVPGLGVFKVGVRAARTGRNPKTGEALQIAQRNSIRFTATPTWKSDVQAFKVQTKPKAAK